MKELELEFKGRAEVKNHLFTQKHFDGSWYIYQVQNLEYPESKPHYEVFKRMEMKASPPFIPEDLVRYPTSINFGVTAWTVKTLDQAFSIIEKRKQEKEDDLSLEPRVNHAV